MPGNNNRKYHAFISYRHADNKEEGRQWATWLHRAIETYEVPADLVGTTNARGEIIEKRIYPVFRDEEELPTEASLAGSITGALENSRLLIVLCSPNAVASKYVADEIEYFKKLGRSDRIVASIIDGEPNASWDEGKRKHGFSEDDECFPVPLQFEYDEAGKRTERRAEPIAADFRFNYQGRPEIGWTSKEAHFQYLSEGGKLSGEEIQKAVAEYSQQRQLMLLKVISGILGVPLGVLTQRDKAYQLKLEKERARRLRRWLAIVALLGVVAVSAGVVALLQKQEAERQSEIATEQERKANRELYNVSMLVSKDMLKRNELPEIRHVIENVASEFRNIEWHWYRRLSDIYPWESQAAKGWYSFDGSESIFVLSEKKLFRINKKSGEVVNTYDLPFDYVYHVNEQKGYVFGLENSFIGKDALVVFDMHEGREIKRIHVGPTTLDKAVQLDDNSIYFISDRKAVNRLNTTTLQHTQVLPQGGPADEEYYAVYFDAAGQRYFLENCCDTFLFDQNVQFVKKFEGEMAGFSPLSPDGKMVALVKSSHARVYDLQSGEVLFEERLHYFSSSDRYGPDTKVNLMRFIDNETLLSGGNDNTVMLVDLASWPQRGHDAVTTLGDTISSGYTAYPIYAAEHAGDGSLLVLGESGLHRYSGANYVKHQHYTMNGAAVRSMVLSEQATQAYLVDENGKVKRWNLEVGLSQHFDKPQHAVISGDDGSWYSTDAVFGWQGGLQAHGVWSSGVFPENKLLSWFKTVEGDISATRFSQYSQGAAGNTATVALIAPADAAPERYFREKESYRNQRNQCITTRQAEEVEFFNLSDCDATDTAAEGWQRLSVAETIREETFVDDDNVIFQTEGEHLLLYNLKQRQIIKQWHLAQGGSDQPAIEALDAALAPDTSLSLRPALWESHYLPDKKWMILSRDDQVVLFDVAAFNASKTLSLAGGVEELCVSPDNSQLAVVQEKGVVNIDLSTDARQHIDLPESADWCRWLDNRHMVIDSLRYTLLWDSDRQALSQYLLNTASAEDDNYDATIDSYRGMLPLLWDESRRYILEYGYQRGSFDYYDEYDEYNPWKKTGKREAARIYDKEKSHLSPWFSGFKPGSNRVFAINKTGQQVYLSTDGKRGGIWKLIDGEKQAAVGLATGELTYARFSQDSQWLALGSSDRLIRIFRVDNGQLARELPGHDAAITWFEWLSNDTRLLSLSSDNVLNLWDPASGTILFTHSLTGTPQKIIRAEAEQQIRLFYPDRVEVISLER